MSGVDVADTIRTLATVVRLHEGNRDAEVNALLNRAESCCAAVAELIELVQAINDERSRCFIPTNDPTLRTHGWDEKANTTLARVGGAS